MHGFHDRLLGVLVALLLGLAPLQNAISFDDAAGTGAAVAGAEAQLPAADDTAPERSAARDHCYPSCAAAVPLAASRFDIPRFPDASPRSGGDSSPTTLFHEPPFPPPRA